MKKLIGLAMVIVLCLAFCSCMKTTSTYHKITDLESGCWDYFEVEVQGVKVADNIDINVVGLVSGNFYIKGIVHCNGLVLVTITNISNETLSTNNFEYLITAK